MNSTAILDEQLDARTAAEIVFPPTAAPELPAGWHLIKQLMHRFEAVHPARQLQVHRGDMLWKDGRRWAFVRVSKPKRVPSHEDLCYVKNVFIGADLDAYGVYEAKHRRQVGQQPNTIYLYCPLDGPVLPEFSHVTQP